MLGLTRSLAPLALSRCRNKVALHHVLKSDIDSDSLTLQVHLTLNAKGSEEGQRKQRLNSQAHFTSLMTLV